MKSKLVGLLITGLMVASLNAANYTITNVGDGLTDTLYADANNVLLSTGTVTLGVFATGFDVGANLNNLPALLSNYSATPFASGTIGAPSALLGAAFSGYVEAPQVDGAPLLASDQLIGRTLYSFIGNGATLASSSTFALLSLGRFQNEEAAELDYISDPKARIGSPLIGTLRTISGNLGGQGVGTYETLQLVAVASVPEPSALLIGALSSLVLFRRQRN
jgi:hypothetical protein